MYSFLLTVVMASAMASIAAFHSSSSMARLRRLSTWLTSMRPCLLTRKAWSTMATRLALAPSDQRSMQASICALAAWIRSSKIRCSPIARSTFMEPS
ncbi:hypothetical protein D3C79_937680 [compost metagenome]